MGRPASSSAIAAAATQAREAQQRQQQREAVVALDAAAAKAAAQVERVLVSKTETVSSALVELVAAQSAERDRLRVRLEAVKLDAAAMAAEFEAELGRIRDEMRRIELARIRR
jgi:hypothetical protein